MHPLIWIPVVVVGAAFQTARNALQRTLVGDAGPWGATLVRFLFGLPFALVWLGAAYLVWGPAPEALRTAPFALFAGAGALAQILATAALLLAMRQSNFAVGAFFQQVALPITAAVGFLFGDALSALAVAGVAVTTVGLLVMSWPQAGADGVRDWSAARYGLMAGAAFGLSGNCFREAAHAVSTLNPAFAAAATLVMVQALQTAGLTAFLLLTDRRALRAAVSAWRVSLGAGFCGWAASACTFTALAMAPAALVRVVAVVDMPFAALAGRTAFRERLTARQIAGAALIGAGVVACALGALSLSPPAR
ncbi:MAG: DMT family transporter [Hyphomonadaceae bacterium]|nr:DMT family transporter [Hyphomonadaceae bacterium]